MTDRERILHRPRHRRPVDIHVGARIHDRRRFLGLGRSDLARALGLSVQQIQKYENGDSTVSASRLYQIGVELRVEPSYFFEDMEPEPDGVRAGFNTNGLSTPSAAEMRRMSAVYRTIQNPDIRYRLYALACAMAQSALCEHPDNAAAGEGTSGQGSHAVKGLEASLDIR